MKQIGLILLMAIVLGCTSKPDRLPFLGNPIVQGKDTLYPRIKDFSFINQDSIVITNDTFKDKVYVADFMFLSCPTICPVMHVQMTDVYKVFKDNSEVSFLSHTIDPERDTVEKLKEFTERHTIKENWYFVTGHKDSIMSIAKKSYFTVAYPDEKEPGGLVHGGGFLLVDQNRYIRGVYDGTNPEETERLIKDIRILLKE